MFTRYFKVTQHAHPQLTGWGVYTSRVYKKGKASEFKLTVSLANAILEQHGLTDGCVIDYTLPCKGKNGKIEAIRIYPSGNYRRYEWYYDATVKTMKLAADYYESEDSGNG